MEKRNPGQCRGRFPRSPVTCGKTGITLALRVSAFKCIEIINQVRFTDCRATFLKCTRNLLRAICFSYARVSSVQLCRLNLGRKFDFTIFYVKPLYRRERENKNFFLMFNSNVREILIIFSIVSRTEITMIILTDDLTHRVRTQPYIRFNSFHFNPFKAHNARVNAFSKRVKTIKNCNPENKSIANTVHCELIFILRR